MKTFNKNIFILSVGFLLLLLIPSFIAAWGADEGEPNQSFPWPLLRTCFDILRFPTHTLFWSVFSLHGTLYLLGLALNLSFYGLLFERLFYLIERLIIDRKIKRKKNT